MFICYCYVTGKRKIRHRIRDDASWLRIAPENNQTWIEEEHRPLPRCGQPLRGWDAASQSISRFREIHQMALPEGLHPPLGQYFPTDRPAGYQSSLPLLPTLCIDVTGRLPVTKRRQAAQRRVDPRQVDGRNNESVLLWRHRRRRLVDEKDYDMVSTTRLFRFRVVDSESPSWSAGNFGSDVDASPDRQSEGSYRRLNRWRWIAGYDQSLLLFRKPFINVEEDGDAGRRRSGIDVAHRRVDRAARI